MDDDVSEVVGKRGAAMKEVRYALVVRDVAGRRLAVQGSNHESFNIRGKVAPAFHRSCASLLALYAGAARVEAVSWQEGGDVEQAPVLVVASRTEQVGQLAYQVAGAA